MYLKCIRSAHTLPPNPLTFTCPACGALLDVIVKPDDVSPLKEAIRNCKVGVWAYREALPVPDNAEPVSLGEGGTPLISAPKIAGRAGLKKLYVKYEGANPTGSFKDRGMTVGVTIAKIVGAEAIIVASTGNTSSSAAAYAARAGIKSIVILPKGKVAKGKLSQSILHGSSIIEVEGSFDDALKAVMETAKETGNVYPLNSFNPWRLEGQKTLAYEIVAQLQKVPDAVIVPVGNAGNISAIWKGFKELKEWGIINRLPRMYGVQAEGAAPIARMFERGQKAFSPVINPETIATAIRIGKPVNWPKAVRAVKESGGTVISVTDEDIMKAQEDLARLEGVGVEPASAAPIAAFRRLRELDYLRVSDITVTIATGHALKDPEAASSKHVLMYSVSSPEEAVEAVMRLVEHA